MGCCSFFDSVTTGRSRFCFTCTRGSPHHDAIKLCSDSCGIEMTRTCRPIHVPETKTCNVLLVQLFFPASCTKKLRPFWFRLTFMQGNTGRVEKEAQKAQPTMDVPLWRNNHDLWTTTTELFSQNRTQVNRTNSCHFFSDYAPYERPECRFPAEYQGEWILFGNKRKDTVTIGPGEMTFSHLDHFICKSKHWAMHQYKLLSVFKNGW